MARRGSPPTERCGIDSGMRSRHLEPTGRAVEAIALPIVLCIALYLVNFDIGATNLAVSAVQADFHVPLPTVIWFVDGYVLAMACSVLPSGMMCDRFGAKRMLMVGVGGFASASLISGVAWSPAWLVAARIVQGYASGIIIPASIATIAAAHVDQRVRARLVGFLAIAGGIGIASSPLIAGWLIAGFGWRAIFLVNVPLTVVAAAVLLATDIDEQLGAPEPLPLRSIASLVVAMGASAYLLIEWPKVLAHDLSLLVVGAIVMAAMLVFTQSERAASVRLVPRSLSRNRRVALLCWIGALSQGSAFAVMFLISLQRVRWEGLALDTVGSMFIWLTAPLLMASVGLAFVMHRFATRPVAVAGLIVSSLGLFVLASDGSMMVAFSLLGCGLALLMPPISLGILRSVEPQRAGTATGMLNASRQLGALVGIAFSGAAIVLALHYRLGDALPLDTLMRAAAGDVAGLTAGTAHTAHDAFDAAARFVFIATAATMLASAPVAWVSLKSSGARHD